MKGHGRRKACDVSDMHIMLAQLDHAVRSYVDGGYQPSQAKLFVLRFLLMSRNLISFASFSLV